MDEKKTDVQQPIVIYGMANIGCDQRYATFQTLTQGREPQQDMKAEAEQVKP